MQSRQQARVDTDRPSTTIRQHLGRRRVFDSIHTHAHSSWLLMLSMLGTLREATEHDAIRWDACFDLLVDQREDAALGLIHALQLIGWFEIRHVMQSNQSNQSNQSINQSINQLINRINRINQSNQSSVSYAALSSGDVQSRPERSAMSYHAVMRCPMLIVTRR